MKRKGLLIAIAVLVLLAVAAYCAIKFYILAPWEGEATRIYIPAGADVRSELTSQLGPSYGGKVYNMFKWQKGDAARAHGSYLIEHGNEALRVARHIARGMQTPLRATFSTARTPGNMATLLAGSLECDSASIMAAIDSTLSARRLTSPLYATAFMPDSYEFYWTASPATVVDKLIANSDRFWNDERLAKAAALGLSPEQVYTLASIAASETNMSDEWGKVARLYLNRMELGMPLQADPTVVFALGDFTIRRVTGQHLKVESDYNTYTHQGLPPGPIRLVDGRQLDAVLDAPRHKYLYMCAKPDFSGYHNFATDYNRHRINAALYYKALTARGL